MSYNIDEYYDSLQMNLPVLYYDGRNNPPHPEVWIKYYLKIFSLYASKVLSIALKETSNNENERLSHLSNKAKQFLEYLNRHNIIRFAPIDLSYKLKVTNRTIINWCSELAKNGYIMPIVVEKRIRQYEVIAENDDE
jgi:hypothetical protein